MEPGSRGLLGRNVERPRMQRHEVIIMGAYKVVSGYLDLCCLPSQGQERDKLLDYSFGAH